jgi:hypothetical protein
VDWTEVSKNLQDKLEDIKKQLPDTGRQKEMTIKIKKKRDEVDKALADAGKESKVATITVIGDDDDQPKSKKSSVYAYSNSAAGETHVSAPAYDNMLKKMEADGLIDLQSPYKVEKKDNSLFINDVEQTKSVYKKYDHYFHNKNVTVKGDKNLINVNVTD